jgi:phage tail sheath gpL-like
VVALYPPVASSVFKATEIESALSGGVTPLRPTKEGDRSEIVRLVTTKVTTSSAPDFATFDLATSRTAAYMARQVDIRYTTEFSQELLVTDDDAPENVLKRVRDMLIGVHEAMETQRYIRDLDSFLPQIIVEENASVAGRLDASNPFRVVSPLHQAAFVHHAYL